MTKHEIKPWSFFKPDPNNPRKACDESELDRLGDDMVARGVLVPLLAKFDGTLIDGSRRWLAAQRKGIKELPVILTDCPEAEIAGVRLATVFHKVDLKPAEKCLAVNELAQAHPEWGNNGVAAYLHIDPAQVTRWLAYSKVTPAWQEAFKAGKVISDNLYSASKLETAEQQNALLAFTLQGANRAEVEKEVARQKRKPTADSAVKLGKAVFPVSKASRVTVVAEGMTLEKYIEILGLALDSAKRSLRDQLDLKTAVAVWAQKNKAGA